MEFCATSQPYLDWHSWGWIWSAASPGFLGPCCPATASLIHSSSVATLNTAAVSPAHVWTGPHSKSHTFCDLNCVTLYVTEISLQKKWHLQLLPLHIISRRFGSAGICLPWDGWQTLNHLTWKREFIFASCKRGLEDMSQGKQILLPCCSASPILSDASCSPHGPRWFPQFELSFSHTSHQEERRRVW